MQFGEKNEEKQQLNTRKFRGWRWSDEFRDGEGKKVGERRMRKWAESKWCDSRTQRKAKGEIGSVRRIERGDCVLF